ncbi:MAG: leucine-rich repeat domain-containing protein [Oscillospiraceae bacterium]|nr:leucine-rich repeat domain-containing protein [Oscillospiraceae bacterium]
MSDVFISYKAEEFDEADRVRNELEENGLSCWMAPMSIPGGSSYAVEIPQAIREAKVFVLILSEKTQTSRWVPRELDQAINEGKTILPFMLENCPLRDEFSFYLSNVQRYAAYENRSAVMKKMIRQIRSIVGPENSRESTSKADVVGDEKKPGNEHSADAFSGKKPGKKPSKQSGNQPEKKTEKKKGKAGKALLGIAAGLLILIVFVSVMKKLNTVTIAGERFSRSDLSISIEEKQLSNADIAAFTRCKKLMSVYLTGCEIPANGLQTLFSMASFQLELVDCGLTDEMLAGVDFTRVNVEEIFLDGNPALTDLRPLSALGEEPEVLSFDGCSVADLSFVSELTALTDLSLDGNQVEDISPLRACTALQRLSMADNQITDLSALSDCRQLDNLSVNGNRLTNLAGLEQCIQLRRLYASGNAITDIEGIQNATILTEVDLGNNSISDVSLLGKSKDTLENLDISHNEIESIASLSGCTRIEELNVSGNRIETLDALSGMTELTVLKASGNGLTDIAGIAGCRKLVTVDLSDNEIAGTDPLCLEESGNTVTLDLSHNRIDSLTLPTVTYDVLALYGNPISDLSAVNDTGGSTLIIDYDPSIDFEALGRSDYYEYYVFNCPLYRQVSIGDILGSSRTHFTTEREYREEESLPETVSRGQKDGFDSITNEQYRFSEYTVEIPSYWSDDQRENKGTTKYAETGDKVAMLQIEARYDTDEDYPVTFEGLMEDLDGLQKVVESRVFKDSIDHEVVDTGYVKGVLFKGYSEKYQNTGLEITGEWFTFPSEKDRNWCSVILVQSDNTEYLYDDDFMKIINSIRPVD